MGWEKPKRGGDEKMDEGSDTVANIPGNEVTFVAFEAFPLGMNMIFTPDHPGTGVRVRETRGNALRKGVIVGSAIAEVNGKLVCSKRDVNNQVKAAKAAGLPVTMRFVMDQESVQWCQTHWVDLALVARANAVSSRLRLPVNRTAAKSDTHTFRQGKESRHQPTRLA